MIDERFDWEGDSQLRTPWHETVIYEAHVKGLTKLNERIREDLRARTPGSPPSHAIAYLRELDVTAIELLPIHHIADEASSPRRADELLGLLVDRLPRAAALYAATGRPGTR